MKKIRVAMIASAIRDGVLRAPFARDDAFRYQHDADDWSWDSRFYFGDGSALVDVPINTLEPTDDGDPDELQLCEQAQREERAK